jgi:hypothetical protein
MGLHKIKAHKIFTRFFLCRADDNEASIYKKSNKRWKRREKKNIYQRKYGKPHLGLGGL